MTQQLLLLQDQTPPDRDICARRHGGNAESVAAHERLGPSKESRRNDVYVIFRLFGERGATCEQIAEALHWTINRVSPRLTELKRDGWVIKIGFGRTHGGSVCAILRALTPAERKDRGYEGA